MKIKLRQQIEEIVSLTDEEFELVLSHFEQKAFKKHKLIIQQGDYVRHDYFVVKGLMKASRISSEGKEHIIHFAMENWWITDPEAFHYGTKASLSVDCLEDSIVFSLSLENKEKLCHDLQKMEYFFRKKTTAGYIALQKRIMCFISSKSSERYHNLLEQYPDLIQRIPKTMIASYLGVSRETLSRLIPA
ncbi:Crp/Fnr family transcriptional regulator [Fulvivirga sp. M361]|uniref:Crp/Fnr family transcriptional regulator n=1 Tax=Fulvivirga sp. M361 TaxID=2594266 RepID=UPI00117BC850|nr:Crp/Fnr family transcriptional regulator [Fulvivirga sp. M361]TRX61873.1 Crp/Fnr family transcriptional regulator [Fulvivirga sp. M361]